MTRGAARAAGLRARNALGREGGAETVQLAICIPIAICAAFAALQLALMGYSAVTTSAACEQAAWEVDAAALAAAQASGDEAECERLVAEAIDRCAGTTLWAVNLRVEPCTDEGTGGVSGGFWRQQAGYGASSTESAVQGETYFWGDDGGMYEASSLRAERVDGLVRFRVEYEMPSLIALPGLSGATVGKNVVRERVTENRMEVQ